MRLVGTMGTPCFSPRSATLATLSTAHKVRPFGSSASNGVHLRGVIATKGDLARLHLMTKDNRRREANGDRSGSVKLILDQHIASRPKTNSTYDANITSESEFVRCGGNASERRFTSYGSAVDTGGAESLGTASNGMWPKYRGVEKMSGGGGDEVATSC